VKWQKGDPHNISILKIFLTDGEATKGQNEHIKQIGTLKDGTGPLVNEIDDEL
jgi:hypothetical protein